MKKIFLTLFVTCIGLVRSFAQDADLQAWIYIDTFVDPLTDTVDRTGTTAININQGQTFSPSSMYAAPNGATADSLFAIWGYLNNGPDALEATDKVAFISSFQPKGFLTQAECDAQNPPVDFNDRYFWAYTSGAFGTPVEAGSLFGRGSYYEIDSIQLLLDWQLWVDSAKLKLVGPPHDVYQNNQAYGLFIRTYGLNSTSAPTNQDANMRNNIYVQKVIWNGGGVGLKDFVTNRKHENLTIYPNPATAEIKFDYSFKVNTTAALLIRDVTGKVVGSYNYGRQMVGDRTFKYDISRLPAGNYSVEFMTGEASAVSKLVIK